ncbi:TIGR00269 family protein [Thermogladius calderae]|uniref:TIGR00269 family protein n=1 Tax=Thermogladius calderae TaxID=1200300 RepID=UPI00064F80D3|nr:TIGR00269 family protein [Thermogladius calderae]
MAKCSLCGRPAVYVNRVNKTAYCRQHFIEYFERKVKKTIRKYRMLGKTEHIVVAVSGGKDSMALLYFLWKMSKKNPGWRVSALIVDEGIRGYREYTIANFLRVNERLGVPYKIASFKEYFGMTLDEIVEEGRRRGLPYLPCAYCGVFRRYLLNKVAREMGGTVLATAHNMDDVVQTFIMNLAKDTLDKLARLAPVTGIASHEKFVRRIKPFIEVTEKETSIYALLNGLIEPEYHKCPYAEFNVRFKIRKMINELEEAQPGTKNSLLNSYLSIVRLLGEKRQVGEVKTCKICGEPSSHDVCRACQFRIGLGILEKGVYELKRGL